MVLIGAILEVRQAKHKEAYNKAFQQVIVDAGIISPIYPPELKGLFSIIKYFTHGLVLAGIIIWGYRVSFLKADFIYFH